MPTVADKGLGVASQGVVDAPASESECPRPVVLAIDDQAANLRVVAALLGNSGYEVLTALSGEEGLALVATARPDLVLLDMRMSGMDGFEVLRLLREAPATAELPVVFLSADDDRENLIRAFNAGADDFVSKPFVGRELLARVRTHVELKRLRDALVRFAREKHELAELVARDLNNHFANITAATDLQCALPAADAELVRLARSIQNSADSGMLFLQMLLEQQHLQTVGRLSWAPFPPQSSRP